MNNEKDDERWNLSNSDGVSRASWCHMPRHILIVVSLKWQLAGFLLAAQKHGPRRITVLKLRSFEVDIGEYSVGPDTKVEFIEALGFYDINSPNFFSRILFAYRAFQRFHDQIICKIASGSALLITDNEHRSIEYFLRFAVRSVKWMHIYEHGLVTRQSNWSDLLKIRLKSAVYFASFRVITGIIKPGSLLRGNFMGKRYYCISPSTRGQHVSGDIFLYANSLAFKTRERPASSTIIFFSSGAFRYSDHVFIRDTIDAFKTTKLFADKHGLQLLIKLKEGESVARLMSIDKDFASATFIDEDITFHECMVRYVPRVLVAADSSTILAESALYGVGALTYEVVSVIIPPSSLGRWSSAGVGTVHAEANLPSSSDELLRLVRDLYRLEEAEVHLKTTVRPQL